MHSISCIASDVMVLKYFYRKPVADSNHVTYEDDLPTYKMQHRNPGTALIFNNKTFRYMNDRKGTDRDKRHLKSTLEKLGFRVYEKYNSSSKDIKDTINKSKCFYNMWFKI